MRLVCETSPRIDAASPVEAAQAGRKLFTGVETDIYTAGMEITRKTIVFDAADMEAESAFWSALLDGTVKRDDDWHSIEVNGVNEVAVQLAPGHVPPQWPNGSPPQQIHLDLFVEDIDAAHEEAVGLGARLLQWDPEGDGFNVYADPAGHPFCLCW